MNALKSFSVLVASSVFGLAAVSILGLSKPDSADAHVAAAIAVAGV